MNRSIRPSPKVLEILLLATLGVVGASGLFALGHYFVSKADIRTVAMEHPLQIGLQDLAATDLAPEVLVITDFPSNALHPCVTVLDPSSPGSLEMFGASSLVAPGCAIHSRSTSRLGVILQDIELLEVASVHTSGEIDRDLEVFGTNLVPYSQGLADPFDGLDLADPEHCDHQYLTLKAGTHQLQPGVYCGGIVSLTAHQIKLAPGTYVIKNGPLVMGGRTSLEGQGVTLVFDGPNSVFSFGVATKLALTAPVDGPLAGFVMIEKPDAPKNRDFIIRSYDARLLEGAVYLPHGRLIIDNYGRVGEGSNWTAVVAHQVHVINGAHLQINTNHFASEVPYPQSSKKTGESMIASID